MNPKQEAQEEPSPGPGGKCTGGGVLRILVRALVPALLACCWQIHLVAQSPQLSARTAANGRVEIRWPGSAANFQLEFADTIAPQVAWRPVTEAAVIEGGNFLVSVDASADERYFRLGSASATRTTVSQSSPADGETGVAVTRETVVHFSEPLADTTVLTTNHFYAMFAGRRILSRIELASDRRKATLFYQEPLPGSARVGVIFGGEGLNDFRGQPIDPAGTGETNGFKLIQFETLSLTPVAGTAVIGRVFASELVPGPDTGTNAINRPLEGVIITVDGREQELRTTTDALGNFTLSPAPAGRFFVKIDGRLARGSSYPDGSYYPYVGKAWEAVAGTTTNLAGGTGEIFLPLITQGTLKPVSVTQDTQIAFPENVIAANPALAGVTLTVPANALFSENGVRGGKVGIAPVPPDRLPEPLPPGLEMPIVITVQTDGGLNFDRPAPICFPNLPDPVLKTALPANSKQALISFDHDKGIWEAVGSMTVSADGKMICTDPGSGILQPGWHGVGPIPDGPPPCGEGLCCPDGDEDDGSSAPFTALSRPNRSPCKKPCKFKQLDACRKQCAAEFELCRQMLLRAMARCQRDHTGQPIECSIGGTCCAYWHPLCKDYLDKKGAECYRRQALLGVLCQDASRQCLDRCKAECPDPVAAFGGLVKQGLEEELIARQILEKLAAFDALLFPYIDSGSAIPEDVSNELNALNAEANALGGGDAIDFLERYARGLEEEQAASDAEFGEDPGNAPPYPVLFAADIARPGSILTLRGETGPFGQYSLFVPRDGVLQSVSFYDPRTKRVGLAYPHLRPEAPYRMPRFNLHPIDETFQDSDLDGLPEVVEYVYGTDETIPDSDGDGILDGAEVNGGTNPLDGQPVRTGIVGTAKTPGAAVDVTTANDLLAVAEGTNGVSVFNIFNGMNPVLVAHVAGLGNAQRVAMSGNFVAVAAGDAGVQIIDITTPASAAVIHRFGRLGAQAIAADVGVAYAGFSSGSILALDMRTGLVRNQFSASAPVWDLALSGDYLYALTETRLFTISLVDGGIASIQMPTEVLPNRRLFVGANVAYTVHGAGFNTFDVTDPTRPALLARGGTPQFGWKHIAPNGSGIGVAAVGINPASPGDVSLYDLSSPRTNNLFLTQFVTPDAASAVSIFNGLAYVADGSAGIQVINYQPYDRNRNAPSISLTTSATNDMVESTTPLRLTANATDDVQVRNVEFYVDGQPAFTDGNFPFEYRFPAPTLTPTKTNFTVRARAIDTGGNFTWSDELTIRISPDATLPRVLTTAPLGGGKVVNRISVSFNETINPATLNADSVRLIAAGPDGQVDTPDDLPTSGGVISPRAENRIVFLDFASPLPDGLYRATVTTAVADTAGNHLAADYSWQFRVADAVFWTRGADGFWEDGANWSSGSVPGPTDNIIIEPDAADITITHRNSTRVIKRLVAGERIVINQGIWQIAESIELHEPLHIAGGTLRGGTVQQIGAGKLTFGANAVNTLDGIRVEGDLAVSGVQVFVRNGLALTGTATLNNIGLIMFAGTQTFDNAQVSLAGEAQLGIEAGSTLTLGSNLVVRGPRGAIGAGGFGARRLINQGLISADGTGSAIAIRSTYLENLGSVEGTNGAAVTVAVETMRNSGLMNAGAGATLSLQGSWTNLGIINAAGSTVNMGGTVNLADLGTFNRTGGAVNLTGVLLLNGGTLTLDAATGSWGMQGGALAGGTVKQTEGSKLLFIPNSVNTFDTMRIEGDLELNNYGEQVRVRNGLVLAGVARMNHGILSFSGNQTLNSGEVSLLDDGQIAVEPGTTLTLGPAMVVRGWKGSIGSGGFGTRTVINQGLISADVAGLPIMIRSTHFENAGTVECRNGGSITISETSRNAGAINASGGGTLTINGAWTNAGTITMNGATVNFGGTFTLTDLATFNRTGGTVNLTGVLDLGGGTLSLNSLGGSWGMIAGTLRNGKVEQTEGAKLLFPGPNTVNTFEAMEVAGDLELTVGGANARIRNGLTMAGNVILDKAGLITFAGDQTLNTGQIIFGDLGTLALTAGTTLTLGPAMVVRGKGGFIGGGEFGTRRLINQGLLAADVPGGTLTIAPTQFENSGTLRANGAGARLAINAPFTNTGTIEQLNGGIVSTPP